MDAFKDLMEAFSQRIRSPIIGSIAIVFVLVNWKPIWYLLFAERPVRQKFLYFEANTDAISLYCIPIGVGVVYAFGLPWVKWAGAWVAQKPYARLHEIQDDQASARRVKEYERAAKEEKAKANFDATREKAILASAERRQTASKLGEEALTKFDEQRERLDEVENSQPATSGDRDAALTKKKLGILAAFQDQPPVRITQIIKDRSALKNYLLEVPEASANRMASEFSSVLSELEKLGYVNSHFDGDDYVWELTEAGYVAVDESK